MTLSTVGLEYYITGLRTVVLINIRLAMARCKCRHLANAIDSSAGNLKQQSFLYFKQHKDVLQGSSFQWSAEETFVRLVLRRTWILHNRPP